MTPGYGTYEMTSRLEQPVKLLDRKIPLTEMRRILDPISFIYSEDVKTGYGNNVHQAKNTVVWGFEQYGLFVKYEQTLVVAFWLSHSPQFPNVRTAQHLADAIFKTSNRYSLIFVDWNIEFLCRLSSERVIKDYFYQNYSFDYF